MKDEEHQSIAVSATSPDRHISMSSTDDTTLQSDESRSIIAYEIYRQDDMPIIPAPINRQWMDETNLRFAYRCLPLTVANQAGWIVCNPSSFSASWNGGPGPEDTVLSFDDSPPDNRIKSLFGYGTITFNLPYLMRTPPEMNLWVKGPTNWPKHGVQALEGMVESDWTAATFTMNWKITRAHEAVRFERGEPICMLVPYPRELLNSLIPVIQPLSDNAKLESEYKQWSHDRDEFHRLLAERDAVAIRQGWQKDYFQGRDPGKERFDGHQTRLAIRPFKRISDATG